MRRIPFDLPCAGCGYNLRARSAMSKCSECGLAVGQTIVAVSFDEVSMTKVWRSVGFSSIVLGRYTTWLAFAPHTWRRAITAEVAAMLLLCLGLALFYGEELRLARIVIFPILAPVILVPSVARVDPCNRMNHRLAVAVCQLPTAFFCALLPAG